MVWSTDSRVTRVSIWSHRIVAATEICSVAFPNVYTLKVQDDEREREREREKQLVKGELQHARTSLYHAQEPDNQDYLLRSTSL